MSADLAFVNGAVFVADPARSWARAVAVAGGRVAAVGSDHRVEDLIGPGTEVIDLHGRMLAPGFQDAHVHPATGGLQLLRCHLDEAGGPEEALAAIARYAAGHSEEAWIRGGGWAFGWFEGGSPTAELLDRVVSDRPAFLTVRDGHSGWANTKALAAAGLSAATADPPDGWIERRPDGSPRGTLHEGAMRLVERAMPEDTVDELVAGLLEGQRYLFSNGVTAWQDAIVEPTLHQAYRRAASDGRLVGRVRGALWWERGRGVDQVDDLLARREEGVGGYVPGAVKLMLDGICENLTASMIQPYLDRHGTPTAHRGLDFIDPEELAGFVARLDALGFQCHFHAIGDRAVRHALDAVETARAANGWNDLRHHIAHLQVVDPSDLPRFRRLGVAANAQPLWACAEPQLVEVTNPFLGEERARRQYPFGDLLHHGAVLAMGSDWSVSTADVMDQVSVAVTRLVPADAPSEPFLAEQRIDLADALAAFTAGSAFVNHFDADRGTLRSGAVADLVVLDRNPFEVERIWEVEVDLTVVGGEVVYRREGQNARGSTRPTMA